MVLLDPYLIIPTPLPTPLPAYLYGGGPTDIFKGRRYKLPVNDAVQAQVYRAREMKRLLLVSQKLLALWSGLSIGRAGCEV